MTCFPREGRERDLDTGILEQKINSRKIIERDALHESPFSLKVLCDIVLGRREDFLDRNFNSQVCSYFA